MGKKPNALRAPQIFFSDRLLSSASKRFRQGETEAKTLRKRLLKTHMNKASGSATRLPSRDLDRRSEKKHAAHQRCSIEEVRHAAGKMRKKNASRLQCARVSGCCSPFSGVRRFRTSGRSDFPAMPRFQRSAQMRQRMRRGADYTDTGDRGLWERRGTNVQPKTR